MAEVRDVKTENGEDQSDCTDDDETLDPRVKEELEQLNKATDAINSLELELDDARAAFRQSLTESTNALNAEAKKLGSCIDKARPYYEARQTAKEAQQLIQDAALKFERANSMLAAAKEMVDVAEHGLIVEKRTFDANWQEMLNHATMKVNEAEHERHVVELEHQRTAWDFEDAEKLVKKLQKSLKKNISKSRPYFDMKHQFNQQLEDKKKRVTSLEKKVCKAKQSYSLALKTLEAISDRIHRQRSSKKMTMGPRGHGVGAEAPEIQEPKENTKPEQSPCETLEDIDKEFIVLPHRNNSLKRHSLPHPRVRALSDGAMPDPHSIMLAYESTEHLDEDGWDTASHSTVGDDADRDDYLEFMAPPKENRVVATQTDDAPGSGVIDSTCEVKMRLHQDLDTVSESTEASSMAADTTTSQEPVKSDKSEESIVNDGCDDLSEKTETLTLKNNLKTSTKQESSTNTQDAMQDTKEAKNIVSDMGETLLQTNDSQESVKDEDGKVQNTASDEVQNTASDEVQNTASDEVQNTASDVSETTNSTSTEQEENVKTQEEIQDESTEQLDGSPESVETQSMEANPAATSTTCEETKNIEKADERNDSIKAVTLIQDVQDTHL
ncbi:uncharacterized protein LOC144450058 [Glandiceps talaboti]